ncbi:hypothetical protein DFH09DRAFT_1359832 [Mycena vulgaris]|nr:hypothetical protein DFH09DRAFT_1359832 [Mycena vulgaris]
MYTHFLSFTFPCFAARIFYFGLLTWGNALSPPVPLYSRRSPPRVPQYPPLHIRDPNNPCPTGIALVTLSHWVVCSSPIRDASPPPPPSSTRTNPFRATTASNDHDWYLKYLGSQRVLGGGSGEAGIVACPTYTYRRWVDAYRMGGGWHGINPCYAEKTENPGCPRRMSVRPLGLRMRKRYPAGIPKDNKSTLMLARLPVSALTRPTGLQFIQDAGSHMQTQNGVPRPNVEAGGTFSEREAQRVVARKRMPVEEHTFIAISDYYKVHCVG